MLTKMAFCILPDIRLILNKILILLLCVKKANYNFHWNSIYKNRQDFLDTEHYFYQTMKYHNFKTYTYNRKLQNVPIRIDMHIYKYNA